MTSSILQDHSQTFVGVLASLLLITIIWSRDSNFVIKIIDERSSVIKKMWKTLDSVILKGAAKWNFLKHDPDWMYKEMMEASISIENQERLEIRLNDECVNRLMLLDEKIETFKETFVTNYLLRIMPMIDEKIKSLKKSKKVIVSSIFALMSCLLIFVIDETTAIFPSSCDFCASFLCLFLILGSAFWIGMWTSFFLRHLPEDDKGINNKDSRKSLTVTDKKNNNKNQDFFSSSSSSRFIGMLTLCGIMGILICEFIPYIWLKQFIIFGVGMIIPMVWIGCKKMIGRDFKEQNPYSFAINHFLAFCAVAIIWSSIIFLGSKISPDLVDAFFLYSNWNALLIFLEVYLLLIGIIFPIFIPYVNTYRLQRYMEKKKKEPKILIQRDSRWISINNEIENLYCSVSTNEYWQSQRTKE